MKLKNGWIRDKSQESGDVFRWYEKGEITASLVQGNISHEAEWRISDDDFSIKSRGEKDLMLSRSDSRNIVIIKSLIDKEKYL